MDEKWREATSLSYKWQYRTLGGVEFFGPSDGVDAWRSRPDYPLRYFLWKTNRDAWADLDQWRLSEETIQAAVGVLQNELQTLQLQIAEEELNEPEIAFRRTLIEVRTQELDADEILLDGLDEELFQSLITPAEGRIEWDMLTTMLALVHVADGVQMLGRGDPSMAGAHAIKAQDWLLFGRYLRGKAMDEWGQKRALAVSGADAAHSENRRLRKMAIEMYSARSWPSKMQAARVISTEVHRTELVVLRWIRAHTRAA